MTDIWVLMGEDGYLYGMYETELEAWGAAAASSRECCWENGDEHADSEKWESADDVKLFWTIERSDGNPDATTLRSARTKYETPGVGLYYVQRVTAPDWLLAR